MPDVTKLYPRLYIGSAPRSSLGFDVVVLTAREYQPPALMFPGSVVVRIPLDDSEVPLTRRELAFVEEESRFVADLWRSGNDVLVTCWMGRNRSALVSALVLSDISGIPLAEAARHLRESRRDALGVPALQNEYFWSLLQH